MNQSDKDTLAAIETMLAAGIATPAEAILAGYRFGRFNGMLEMAAVGQELRAEASATLKRAAA